MRPRTVNALRGPACSLCDIIKYGYFHQIRLLVYKDVELECRDANKRTPLILCAFMTPEEWGVNTAMTLIENGVSLAHRDRFGRNILHYACIYERENLVQVLLKAIDYNLNESDKSGNTALHYAAMSGNTTITQLLARSFKKYRIYPNKVNSQGRTAREEAVLAGNAACVGVLDVELELQRPHSPARDVRFGNNVILSTSSPEPQTSLPSRTRNLLRPATAAVFSRHDSCLPKTSASDRRSSLSFREWSRSNIPTSGYCR